MLKAVFIFIFPVVIIAINWGVLKRQFSEFYNLIILPNSKVRGTIISVNKVDAVNGTFFDCSIEYVVRNKNYYLFSSISYNVNPNVRVGGVSIVRYNLKRPTIATTSIGSDLIVNIFIWVGLFVWSIIGCILLIKKTYGKPDL